MTLRFCGALPNRAAASFTASSRASTPLPSREIIVDQLLPLRLAGRFALVAQMPRLECVEFCVGTVRVLEFQEDEPVEEPLLCALFIDIGDIGCQPLLIPQERGAVVAAAVT